MLTVSPAEYNLSETVK